MRPQIRPVAAGKRPESPLTWSLDIIGADEDGEHQPTIRHDAAGPIGPPSIPRFAPAATASAFWPLRNPPDIVLFSPEAFCEGIL